MNQIAQLPKRSLVDSMAAKYEMEPAAFMGAVKSTCIKGDCSNEQFAAFLMVAKEYDLNPLTKEIYAFPDRGGITPIVSIDGWMNLINSHPQFDGMEFVDNIAEDGKLHSVECKMYRKDRQRPTSVIEYMSECFRQTDPWKKWPNRMLRHKAAIQCARYAFGFSGIMEPDEYERMKDVTPVQQERPTVAQRLQAAQNATQQDAGEREGFSASFGQEEPEYVLTGEIMDTDTGSTAPRDPVDDAAAALGASSEPADEPPPSSAGNNSPDGRNWSKHEQHHLMDYARKALNELDTQTSEGHKRDFVDNMRSQYLAAVDSDDAISIINAMDKPLEAVLSGKRTVEQARNYIARDLIGCDISKIGG